MASSLAWTLVGTCRPAAAGAAARGSQLAAAAMSSEADTSLAEADERSLVDACLAGHAGAFDLIVERHRRSVYLLCYRFVSNHEDASDLTQDVFLRAYRGLRKFRGHSSLATWLYRIGVNVCLNRLNARTLQRESIDEREYVDTRSESATDYLLRSERAARVRAAIGRLPRKQRATLILRTYHEMSHQEIADVLGSSVGAVKANFFHALGNLKKLLGGGEGGQP
jgi:RNA polymerase sigma-70 factor (ECF subfamily)